MSSSACQPKPISLDGFTEKCAWLIDQFSVCEQLVRSERARYESAEKELIGVRQTVERLELRILIQNVRLKDEIERRREAEHELDNSNERIKDYELRTAEAVACRLMAENKMTEMHGEIEKMKEVLKAISVQISKVPEDVGVKSLKNLAENKKKDALADRRDPLGGEVSYISTYSASSEMAMDDGTLLFAVGAASAPLLTSTPRSSESSSRTHLALSPSRVLDVPSEVVTGSSQEDAPVYDEASSSRNSSADYYRNEICNITRLFIKENQDSECIKTEEQLRRGLAREILLCREKMAQEQRENASSATAAVAPKLPEVDGILEEGKEKKKMEEQEITHVDTRSPLLSIKSAPLGSNSHDAQSGCLNHTVPSGSDQLNVDCLNASDMARKSTSSTRSTAQFSPTTSFEKEPCIDRNCPTAATKKDTSKIDNNVGDGGEVAEYNPLEVVVNLAVDMQQNVVDESSSRPSCIDWDWYVVSLIALPMVLKMLLK